MTFKYFKYELKKSLWPIIILALLGALIYIPVLMSKNFAPINNYKPEPPLGFMGTYLCIVSTIVPIYEFAYLMKKRNIDEFYALPIKRVNIMACRFIGGYVKILISYAIVYFLGMLVLMTKANDFYMVYYLPYFLLSSLLGLALYSFNSFIFTRANSTVDGIIFIILYIFTFYLLHLSIGKFFLINVNRSFDFPYSPISNLNGYYRLLIRYGSVDNIPNFDRYQSFATSYIIWSIIGVLSLVGLYCGSLFDKAERAEQISNSYFGYRILVPLYVVLLSIVIMKGYRGIDFIIYALIWGTALVTFIIYRRTFKLPLKYWFILAGSIILGMFLAS